MGKNRALVPTIVIKCIQFYQLAVSPWLGSACRFTPSCSQYAIEAIDAWGLLKGTWLISKRLIRCHPGCKGGWDPVPKV